MFTFSNILSFLRGPLAFLFLIDRTDVRAAVVLAAMLSDIVDGYLARLYKHTTRLGAILDPVMDKFFVIFVVAILLFQGNLQGWQTFALLSRDAALFVFAVYLLIKNEWRTYNYRSMAWGKAITALQFPVLFFLALGIEVPTFFFALFFVFGICILFELFFTLSPKEI